MLSMQCVEMESRNSVSSLREHIACVLPAASSAAGEPFARCRLSEPVPSWYVGLLDAAASRAHDSNETIIKFLQLGGDGGLEFTGAHGLHTSLDVNVTANKRRLKGGLHACRHRACRRCDASINGGR